MPLHSSSEDDDPDFNNIQFPQDTAMQQVGYFNIKIQNEVGVRRQYKVIMTISLSLHSVYTLVLVTSAH